MKKRFFLSILILNVSLGLFAGRYAGDFMVIGAGVRASGMGGAFAAVADDGSAIYWNPSGIAQMRNTEIGIMRAFLYQGLAAYDNFTFCQPLPNEVTIGLNWTRLTIDDIPVFLERHLVHNVDYRSSFHEFNLTAVPDGHITSTDDILQFAFAKHIHYDLNLGWLFFDLPFDLYFGGNIKYIKREIDENRGTGTGFDFSFLSKTSLAVLFEQDWLGDVAFGINFQDVGGTTITWDVESNHEDEVLFNSKLGVAVRQPLKFIRSSFTLSTDIDYIYGKTRHYGFEFLYQKILGFRLGYYDTNFSTGLSVSFYDFTVDYAFVTNVLANTNRIGLKINF
ncbi:MAG: hypothetical protein K8R49_06475 [Candidatus Cloacimonetes bacterium]|nr:hypothetical protein [Candidatus Cloacimonadota bacterium]